MLRASDYSLLQKIYSKSEKKISKDKNHKKTKILSKDKINLNNLNQNGFCILRGVFSKKYMPYEIGFLSKDQQKIKLRNSIKW